MRQSPKSSIYSTKPRSVEIHEKVIGFFIEKYMFY
ncbi:IS1 family transposase [Enterobacter dykesii]